MSTTILNFEKVEIVAESREAAIAQMEENYFKYLGEATQKYRNWEQSRNGAVTEKDKKEFMLNYLNDKCKCAAGCGYLITVNPAIKDSRQRPYTVENVKGEGKRKTSKYYKWFDKATGTLLGKIDTNKADAANWIKEHYKNGYKGEAYCEIQYDVTEGNPIVMKASYSPSKNTKNGTYIIFGVKA